jgi:glyoxylase-like metal-dependent hydrolase (beta-lactamase superfamily II)
MIRVGDVEIRRVEEILLREPSSIYAEWHRDAPAEFRAWTGPNNYDAAADAFIVSIHSWLVRVNGQVILIDTCGGNCKERPNSPRFHHLDIPFLARLKAVGVAPEDVDLVICTHLHVDHVGWNTQLVDGSWVPTFPNATYILSRVECGARDPKQGDPKTPPGLVQPYLDSVVPVIEAGQVRLVDGTETLLDGVDLIPTPGHSPGQMAVRVRSKGEEALFIGDVTHQPIQVTNPGWNSKYCEDKAKSKDTRFGILEHCAETRCLMLPAHYAAPHYGRVTRKGDRFTFIPGETLP